MAVKIKPASEINLALGINPNGRVQKFFTNTCYKRMDKYVPKDEGNLRKNVSITANSITYESNYAHAQYIGKVHGKPINPENYTTPGTGAYWDKKMLASERGQLARDVQRYINNGGR